MCAVSVRNKNLEWKKEKNVYMYEEFNNKVTHYRLYVGIKTAGFYYFILTLFFHQY